MGELMRDSDAIGYRTWFLTLLTSGLLAIKVGFFSPEQFRLGLYVNWAVPISFLSAGLLIVAVTIYVASVRDQNYRYFDILLALGISLVVWLAVPGRTVMEADESSMISTAQGIYHNFSPFGAVTGVYQQDGTFVAFYEKLDKRGVFFPALIALLDWFFGPNVDHRLFLSWVSGFGVLTLTLRLSRRFLTSAVVPAVPIFLVAMPVFAIHMRGGTFDTMNVAVVLLLVHGSLSFFSAPSLRSLTITSAAAIVAGQIRNESILLAGIIIGLVLCAVAFSPRFTRFRNIWILFLPWTMLPSAIRRVVPFDNELVDPTVIPWSFSNFLDNADSALYTALFGGVVNYGSAIIGTVAMLGVILCSLVGWRSAYRRNFDLNVLIKIAALLLLLPFVLLFYIHGSPDSPVTARYYIVMMIVVCFLAALPWVFVARSSSVRGILAIIFGCYAFLVSLRWTIDAPALQVMERPTNSAVVSRLLAGQAVQCEAVIVTNLARHLIVRGFTAVPRAMLYSLPPGQLDQFAGRKLRVVDLESFEQLPPDQFAEKVFPYRGGVCDRVLKRIVFAGDLSAPPDSSSAWSQDSDAARQ